MLDEYICVCVVSICRTQLHRRATKNESIV